jgi:hypothetical protein
LNITQNSIRTTHAKLKKLALAKRETFLYKHSGVVTNNVTTNTTAKRTAPIDAPHDGTNLTKTFDNVSPTTTLYEIIAVRRRKIKKKLEMKKQLYVWMKMK